MLRIFASLIIISIVFAIPARTQITDKNHEKNRQSAIKIAAEGDHKAEVQFKSGDKRKGTISSVTNESFVFTDSKSGQSQTVAFSDVNQIKKHKKGLSTGGWIGIGVAAGAVVTVLIFRSILCKNEPGAC